MDTFLKLFVFLISFIGDAAATARRHNHGVKTLPVENLPQFFKNYEHLTVSWQGEQTHNEKVCDCSCAQLTKSKLCNVCPKIGKSKHGTKYPLTPPTPTPHGLKYRIGIIRDLDQNSKTSDGNWVSYFKKGFLQLQFNRAEPRLSKVFIEWDVGDPLTIESGLNENGRGMELSELFTFKNRIYACDDHTGIVFNIHAENGEKPHPVPWIILNDGNGTLNSKGLKCEWATVKNGELWIGNWGMPWLDKAGNVVNHNPQFVKKVAYDGGIQNFNWTRNFDRMSSALGIHFPGYVVHESGGWSDKWKKWMFLPRRVSAEPYNHETDEHIGSNSMILADEHFENIQVRKVGELIPSRGFSSFKWVPGTGDELVVALKTVELEGKTETYILVFTMKGEILVPETQVANMKYEGIEFL